MTKVYMIYAQSLGELRAATKDLPDAMQLRIQVGAPPLVQQMIESVGVTLVEFDGGISDDGEITGPIEFVKLGTPPTPVLGQGGAA